MMKPMSKGDQKIKSHRIIGPQTKKAYCFTWDHFDNLFCSSLTRCTWMRKQSFASVDSFYLANPTPINVPAKRDKSLQKRTRAF